MAVSIKPRCLNLLLHLSLPFLLLSVANDVLASGRALLPGGWSPVDPNNSHVKDIGIFSVQEHNRLSGDHLVFQKVVSGSSQVVAGINYNLTVAAATGVASKHYEAVVWEQAWRNYRNLTSFKPLD